MADPEAGKSDANEAGDGAASIFEKVNSRRAETIECSQLECERSAADLIAKRPLTRHSDSFTTITCRPALESRICLD